MKFSIDSNAFAKALAMAFGAIKNDKSANQILSNFKLSIDHSKVLKIVASDLEVEIVTAVTHISNTSLGATTVPAKKLLDIIKNLTGEVNIETIASDNSGSEICLIQSGKSRFKLQTLHASQFPSISESKAIFEITVPSNQLVSAIKRTSFAMANQDVRYYLNGSLLEFTGSECLLIATDGHRLAKTTIHKATFNEQSSPMTAIIPRKGVIEIEKLVSNETGEVKLSITENHLSAETTKGKLTTKLIDGRFPDWRRVMPNECKHTMKVDRLSFKSSVNRVSVLANEKYRGIRLIFSNNLMEIDSSNPDLETGHDSLLCECNAENIEIGLNVNYLNDILTSISDTDCILNFTDGANSLHMAANDQTDFILMPIRI